MTEISAVQVYRVDLPLLANLEHASASETVLEEVFLRVLTSSGVWGLAEIRGNGSYATGTDTATVLHELVHGAKRAMVGVELHEASEQVSKVYGRPLVRALADIAVLDAIAREDREPLWRLLGGRYISPIPTHAQIGFCSLAQAVTRARAAAAAGFKRIKLRVGRGEPQADIAIVRGVRDEVGSTMELAIDANGGWEVETAIRILETIEASGIAWVEQPTPPGNDHALRTVRQATSIPIIGDEAIRCPGDLTRLCEVGAIDGVHLKLEKAGSTTALISLADQARNAGLDVYIGQMDQGRLGSSVTAHLAASIDAVAYEIWGFQQVARDVTTGFEVQNGAAILPTGPGTGVDVDLNMLELVKEII